MKLTNILFDDLLFDRKTIELEARGFKFIGAGNYRKGFARNNLVVKVPLGYAGLFQNMIEAYAYHLHRKKSDTSNRNVVYAPAKLLRDGLLGMVFVAEASASDLPEWCCGIDRSQVGLYNNRVVVYDSGDDNDINLVECVSYYILDLQSKLEFLAEEYRELERRADKILCASHNSEIDGETLMMHWSDIREDMKYIKNIIDP